MAVRSLRRADVSDPFPSAILDSLSEAVVVVDGDATIHYANLSAEQFFGVGRARLVSHPLVEFVPEDTPLFSLLEQVMVTGGAVAENGVTLSSPRIGNRFCALRLSPIVESDGLVAVSLTEQSIARSIDRQMSNRSAARSVSALAAMEDHGGALILDDREGGGARISLVFRRDAKEIASASPQATAAQ